jgi:hypothetical protein
MTLHDSSNVRTPLFIAVLLVFFSTIAVILRFASRRIKRAEIGADDWAIVIALVRSSPVVFSSTQLTIYQFWTYAQLGLQTTSKNGISFMSLSTANWRRCCRWWCWPTCICSDSKCRCSRNKGTSLQPSSFNNVLHQP